MDGGSSTAAPGPARGRAASGSRAAACRPRQELPSAARAQTRIKRVVQEQKRSIFRHKQHFKKLHAQTHTHRRPTTTGTHTRARAHTLNHSHKLLERRAIHRNAPSSPTAHPLPPPFSFLFSKNKPPSCKGLSEHLRTNGTYKNRPFAWIILYIKCSKSCLISTYNKTFFSCKRKHQKRPKVRN